MTIRRWAVLTILSAMSVSGYLAMNPAEAGDGASSGGVGRVSFEKSEGNGNLVWIKIKNAAVIRVDGIEITQQDKNDCPRVNKRYKGSVDGKAKPDFEGQHIWAQIYDACTYKVHYTIKTSCRGDKGILVKPEDDKTVNGKPAFAVRLTGRCIQPTGVNTRKHTRDTPFEEYPGQSKEEG